MLEPVTRRGIMFKKAWGEHQYYYFLIKQHINGLSSTHFLKQHDASLQPENY